MIINQTGFMITRACVLKLEKLQMQLWKKTGVQSIPVVVDTKDGRKLEAVMQRSGLLTLP